MPSDLHIRRAAPADAPAIDALTQAAYAKWVPVIGRKPLPMLADYTKAVVEHEIWLAEIDDILAALVELEVKPDHLLIVNLAVHPTGRGRGSAARCSAMPKPWQGNIGSANCASIPTRKCSPTSRSMVVAATS